MQKAPHLKKINHFSIRTYCAFQRFEKGSKTHLMHKLCKRKCTCIVYQYVLYMSYFCTSYIGIPLYIRLKICRSLMLLFSKNGLPVKYDRCERERIKLLLTHTHRTSLDPPIHNHTAALTRIVMFRSFWFQGLYK